MRALTSTPAFVDSQIVTAANPGCDERMRPVTCGGDVARVAAEVEGHPVLQNDARAG